MKPINYGKIDNLHPDVRETGIEPLFLATYESGGKRLQFLAAHHTRTQWQESGPPLVVKPNPTLPFIAEIMRETPPKCVILECSSSIGTSSENQQPFSSIPSVIQSIMVGKEHHDGEPAYAATMCTLKGIPYTGAEPSDAELMPLLEAQGFSSIDLQGLRTLREFTKTEKEAHVSLRQIMPLVESYCKNQSIDCENFMRWFDQHKPADAITFEDTVPYNFEGSNHFQKFAYAFGRARDQFLYQKIDQALQEYGDVLVVYGEAHFFHDTRALAQKMGEPIIKSEVTQDRGFDISALPLPNKKGLQQERPQPDTIKR